MKETFISRKVSQIMEWRNKPKKTADRMAKDRKIAAIGNQISQELDRATEEYKRHITRYVHHLLKDELK